MQNKSIQYTVNSRQIALVFALALFAAFWLLAIAFCLLFTPKAHAAATLQKPPTYNSGLIGYWSMNGADYNAASSTAEVLDRSGSNSNGDNNGAIRIIGKNGQALSFDGAGTTYVELSNSSTLGLSGAADARTVSAWVKTTAGDASIVGMRNSGNGNPVFDFQIGNDGLDNAGTGIPSFLVRSDVDGLAHIHGSAAVNDGQWHHVVAVRDSSKNMYLYVDGVVAGNGADTMSTGQTMNRVRIGDESENSSITNMNGSIDEVRIYNRALSASEILALYRAGSARANSSQNNRLTSGLVGLWSFNGGDYNAPSTTAEVLDRSGNNNNGNNSGSRTALGKIGQALQFDGVDDVVQVGYNSSLNLTTQVTMAVWVKTSSNGPFSIFRRAADFAPYEGYALDVNVGYGCSDTAGEVGFWVGDNSSLFVCALQTINDGNWHHVVGTYNGSLASVYIDGVLSNSETRTNGLSNTGDPLYIGYNNTQGGGGYLSGLADEARLYNRALDAGEVKSLYRLGSSAVNTSQNSRLTNGLVGLWSFNGADYNAASTTAEVLDRSGNSNNGDSVGATRVIGNMGQALNFNGLTNYVNIPSNAVYDATNGTWSFWMKIKNMPVGNGDMVMSRSDSSTSVGAGLLLDPSGTLGLGTIGGCVTSGSAVLSANQWYHVVFTFSQTNGATNTVYINGSQDNTCNNTGSWTFNSQAVRLADALDPFWEIFDGVLDDVRIYNRTLSGEEVKALYNIAR